MDVKGEGKAVKKYFMGIVIPGEGQTKIETIKQDLRARHNLRGALRSAAHITLHRPFEWKESRENELIRKLSEFDLAGNFTLELSNFDVFAPRVIFVNVLKNEELFLLHEQLAHYAQKNLKLLNEINDRRGFHPHVTVAFRDLKPNRFETVWQEFKTQAFDFSFQYTGFSLLKLEQRWEEIAFFGKKT